MKLRTDPVQLFLYTLPEPVWTDWEKPRKYESRYRVFGSETESDLYEAERYDRTPASLTFK